MLSKAVTFIVGAGASREFMLPDGKALSDQIARALDINWDMSRGYISGDPQIAETLKGTSPGNQWQRACWRIREGLPGLADSIDNYLDNHRDDEDMQRAGRVAIVKSILVAEDKSTLQFKNRHTDSIDFQKNQDTWLAQLFRTLQRQCHKGQVGTFFKNCRIVTFNYDRCIEHFFEHALVRHYHISREQAQALVCGAQIVHAYGTVGRLPGHSNDRDEIVAFGDTDVRLLDLSQRIRTYAEQTSDGSTDSKIRDYASNADVIVFLGFGFHPQNLALITPPKGPSAPMIIGSAFEISDFNRDMYQKDLERRFGRSGRRPQLMNGKCAEVMREFSGAFDR